MVWYHIVWSSLLALPKPSNPQILKGAMKVMGKRIEAGLWKREKLGVDFKIYDIERAGGGFFYISFGKRKSLV